MSQYPQYPYAPSPYTPPGAPYAYTDPADALLTPARRAGLLMIVNGILALLAGACFVGLSVALPGIDLPPEQTAKLRELETEAGVSLTLIFMIFGTLTLVPGLALAILGFFVRRGGLGSVVTGIVLTALALLLLALNLVGSLFNAGAAGALCLLSVPLALLILQLTWLIQAARATTSIRAARQYSQQQLWHFQQNQQRYVQALQWPFQQPPPPPPGDRK